MFVLNDDMSIYATRGDTVFFTVGATDGSGAKYKFKPDDVVRFKAFEKKACENVVAQKDFVITEETEEVNILLTEDDTRFGKIISKPRDYWYEIELNPFTNPQTIIGYDDDGPKVFRLYPESKNIVKDLNEEEFYADAELSMTSTNPVQNQAVTRAVANLSKYIDDGLEGVKDSVLSEEEALRIRGELRRLDAEVTQQKSDFTEHKSAKNPHGTTASDVGALPNTGGTVSGELTLTNANSAKSTKVFQYYGRTYIRNVNEDGTYEDVIFGNNSSPYFKKAEQNYLLYGEHNKDSMPFLPLDGSGIMDGGLAFQKKHGFLGGSSGGVFLQSRPTPNDSSNKREIVFSNATDSTNGELINALLLQDVINNATRKYKIYGEHNKPMGSYMGNGNASERKVYTGGLGSLLHLWCPHHSRHSLVGVAGAITWIYDGTVKVVPSGTIRFSAGTLTITSNDYAYNNNGMEYFYEVL